jgi:hypothetical protein
MKTTDALWQKQQSLRVETNVAIISRSPLVSELGPRSSISANSHKGRALSHTFTPHIQHRSIR